jgi:hypothetical protein
MTRGEDTTNPRTFSHNIKIKPMYQRPNNISDLIEAIQSETEWLETSQGDEIECIGIENLQGILSRYFNTHIKLTQ